MGAVAQMRILGGVIGVAIGQVIIFSRLTSELGLILGPDKLASAAAFYGDHHDVSAGASRPSNGVLRPSVHAAEQNHDRLRRRGPAGVRRGVEEAFESGAVIEKRRQDAKATRMAKLQEGGSGWASPSPPKLTT